MYDKISKTLTAPLAQNGTLVLAKDVDPFRLAASGGVAIVDTTRYTAPTDFTLAIAGNGHVTLTWLNAATIAAGKTFTVGVPLIDQLNGGSDAALAAALLSNAPVPVCDGGQPYFAVPAGATTVLGATGAIGDVLAGLKINPGATPSDILIKDGGSGGSTIFTIKAAAMTANVPYDFWAGWVSKVAGGWAVTTSTTPTAIALGRFT